MNVEDKITQLREQYDADVRRLLDKLDMEVRKLRLADELKSLIQLKAEYALGRLSYLAKQDAILFELPEFVEFSRHFAPYMEAFAKFQHDCDVIRSEAWKEKQERARGETPEPPETVTPRSKKRR